jgi:Homeodomain-like domain
MSATNGHCNGSERQPKRIAKVNAKSRAIKRFLDGASVAAIAKELQCDVRSVYRYIEEVRAQLLAEKRDYFDHHVSALLEQNLEALQGMAGLLSDPDFLRSAEPERISAIGVTSGILSDKTFILLAAAGRHQQRAALGPGDVGDGTAG